MYVQPLDGPLGPNPLSAQLGNAEGQGVALQGSAAPAVGDNISRFVPPWSNQSSAAIPYGDYGNSGSLQGLFGPLMGVLQQLMQMLQSLMGGSGCNNPYGGNGCPPNGNERFFQNATGSSEGDPHLSFNGWTWLLVAWRRGPTGVLIVRAMAVDRQSHGNGRIGSDDKIIISRIRKGLDGRADAG